MRDIPFETILDYTLDFIHIVGAPSLFEEKTAILHVDNYRCLLPCDYVSMIQVRTAKNIDSSEPGHRNHIAYRYATDSFHFSENKPDIGRYGTDLTYKIQGCVIYTSTKDTDIEIAYNFYGYKGNKIYKDLGYLNLDKLFLISDKTKKELSKKYENEQKKEYTLATK